MTDKLLEKRVQDLENIVSDLNTTLGCLLIELTVRHEMCPEKCKALLALLPLEPDSSKVRPHGETLQ